MDIEDIVNPQNPYFRKMVEWVNSYEEGLWDHLERVPCLKPQVGEALLQGFLELACQCQNVGNILSGRQAILSLPRDWVIQQIENVAGPLLQTDDDYEWRRLMELYDNLDKELAKGLAFRAISHSNPHIKEVGESYLETNISK